VIRAKNRVFQQYSSIRDVAQMSQCANTGHSTKAGRTGQIDPELPFKIDPMKGREAPESGRWLKVLAARNHVRAVNGGADSPRRQLKLLLRD
jgi:hypothetical protein